MLIWQPKRYESVASPRPNAELSHPSPRHNAALSWASTVSIQPSPLSVTRDKIRSVVRYSSHNNVRKSKHGDITASTASCQHDSPLRSSCTTTMLTYLLQLSNRPCEHLALRRDTSSITPTSRDYDRWHRHRTRSCTTSRAAISALEQATTALSKGAGVRTTRSSIPMSNFHPRSFLL